MIVHMHRLTFRPRDNPAPSHDIPPFHAGISGMPLRPNFHDEPDFPSALLSPYPSHLSTSARRSRIRPRSSLPNLSSSSTRATSFATSAAGLPVGIDVGSTDARAIGAGIPPALFAYSAFQPVHEPYAIPISVAASAFEISPDWTRSSTAARRAVSWTFAGRPRRLPVGEDTWFTAGTVGVCSISRIPAAILVRAR